VIIGALWFFLRRRKDLAYEISAETGSPAEIDAVESSRHEMPAKERGRGMTEVAGTHELPAER
jgi:hypothetical protein